MTHLSLFLSCFFCWSLKCQEVVKGRDKIKIHSFTHSSFNLNFNNTFKLMVSPTSTLSFLIVTSFSIWFFGNHGAMAFYVSRGGRLSRTPHIIHAQPPQRINDIDEDGGVNHSTDQRHTSTSTSRRSILQTASKVILSNAIISSAVLSSSPSTSYAMNNKSRTEGYGVQYTGGIYCLFESKV